jgi:hypothetical protein
MIDKILRNEIILELKNYGALVILKEKNENGDLNRNQRHNKQILQIPLIYMLQYAMVHSSMPLQPCLGTCPLLQFRNQFYIDGRAPLTGDQAATRHLPTHRETQIE